MPFEWTGIASTVALDSADRQSVRQSSFIDGLIIDKYLQSLLQGRLPDF